jgi:hypothetical protein
MLLELKVISAFQSNNLEDSFEQPNNNSEPPSQQRAKEEQGRSLEIEIS